MDPSWIIAGALGVAAAAGVRWWWPTGGRQLSTWLPTTWRTPLAHAARSASLPDPDAWPATVVAAAGLSGLLTLGLEGGARLLPGLGVLAGLLAWVARVQDRRSRHRRELEGLSRELALMVAAGRDLGSALELVVRDGRGDLAGALREAYASIRLGRSRDEAWNDVVALYPVTRELLSTISLADRQGASVAEPLRELAARHRLDRLRRAEARAQRLPVLLLGPIALCLVPTVFLILLGPFLLDLL